jgi:hypothetical protein
MTFTEALRPALARAMFSVGLWKLGGFMLPEGSVMLVDGGAKLVFRHKRRIEIRMGTRVEWKAQTRAYSDVIIRVAREWAKALSAKDAETWIMTGSVEVFHNPFGEPPEAEAEDQPAATIYMRVPPSLKRRVDEAGRR